MGLQLPVVVLWVTLHLKQPHRKLLSGVLTQPIIRVERVRSQHVPHEKLQQNA